jgi:hypothetical protein
VEKLACFLNGKLVEMLREELYIAKKFLYSVNYFEISFAYWRQMPKYVGLISGASAAGSYILYSSLVLLEFALWLCY